MKGRVRVLAALLALFAFSASFAEQVWAATCAATPAAAASAVAGQVPHGNSGCGEQTPAPAPHHQPQHGQGAGDCPFQALAPGGCVLFSFPAPAAGIPCWAPVTHARIAAAGQSAPVLLLALPHFRPPQA